MRLERGSRTARVSRHWMTMALAVGMVLILAQCKGLRRKPGDACSGQGMSMCADQGSALVCQGGTYVAMPCRGPTGCRGIGSSATCDNALAQEGDACRPTLNELYACTADHKRELACTDGKFTTVRTCKGPKLCSVTSGVVSCDDNLADVGDPCVVDPGDANYACTPDKTLELECDGVTSKFKLWYPCRGPKGCTVEKDHLHCDQARARIGDKCNPASEHSTCNEDASQSLQCSAQSQWIKDKDCPKKGCRTLNTLGVSCE